MRLGNGIFAAFALTAGLAVQGTGWGQTAGNSGAVAAAQRSPSAVGSTPHAASRQTVLDVTLTGAMGLAAHNLKESDFSVKEDRKPQPVRSFQEESFQEAGAGTSQVEYVLPALLSEVNIDVQSAATAGAAHVLRLDALHSLLVDQAAVNNNMVDRLEIPSALTKRPALAAGESGGEVATRPFYP